VPIARPAPKPEDAEWRQECDAEVQSAARNANEQRHLPVFSPALAGLAATTAHAAPPLTGDTATTICYGSSSSGALLAEVGSCEVADAFTWRLRQESNLYLALRRRSFYPLNYGGAKRADSRMGSRARLLPVEDRGCCARSVPEAVATTANSRSYPAIGRHPTAPAP
jgi:hypothetical protein